MSRQRVAPPSDRDVRPADRLEAMRDLEATREDRSAVAPSGLCASCVHLQVLRSKRSVFVRCRRSDVDPAFPRYPRLPVTLCAGYEPPGQPSPTPAAKE